MIITNAYLLFQSCFQYKMRNCISKWKKRHQWCSMTSKPYQNTEQTEGQRSIPQNRSFICKTPCHKKKKKNSTTRDKSSWDITRTESLSVRSVNSPWFGLIFPRLSPEPITRQCPLTVFQYWIDYLIFYVTLAPIFLIKAPRLTISILHNTNDISELHCSDIFGPLNRNRKKNA